MKLNRRLPGLWDSLPIVPIYWSPSPEYSPYVRLVEFQLTEIHLANAAGGTYSGTVVNCVRLLPFGWNQIQHRFGTQSVSFNVYIGEDGTIEYANDTAYGKQQWYVASMRYRISFTIQGDRREYRAEINLKSPRSVWERPHIEIRS